MTVSAHLLNDEGARIKQIVEHYLKSKPAGLLYITRDGWTNIKKDDVVNIMIDTPTPIFYKAVETGYKSDTGEYKADNIKEGIIAVGGMVDYTDFTSCGISAVVTDNASAMKRHIKFYKLIIQL